MRTTVALPSVFSPEKEGRRYAVGSCDYAVSELSGTRPAWT